MSYFVIMSKKTREEKGCYNPWDSGPTPTARGGSTNILTNLKLLC